MPPKLINQHPIVLPTKKINNNDGSALSVKLNQDLEAPVNTFFSIIKQDILLIGGGAIIIIYLICKK